MDDETTEEISRAIRWSIGTGIVVAGAMIALLYFVSVAVLS